MLEKAIEVQEQEQLPDLKLSFGDSRMFGHNSPASFQPAKGLIEIDQNLSFRKKLCSFLFELTNVVQQKRFQEIDDRASKGLFKDGLAYATEIERVEYEGAKLLSETIQACVRDYGWYPCMDEYGPLLRTEWRTFEECLKRQIECGHTQDCIDYFYKLDKQSTASRK